jgi:H+/Cl- antiporter ClcA
MLLFICLIVLAQAYLFPSIIPNYQISDGTAVAHKSTTQDGKIYLLSLLGIVILIAWLISRMRLGDTADAEPIRTTLAE